MKRFGWRLILLTAASKTLCFSLLTGMMLTAQPPAGLELDKTISGELAGGQSRHYTIMVSAGQFFRASILRPSFATVVRLTGPAKTNLVQLNWPPSPTGRESLCWVAQDTGVYSIELSADGPAPSPEKFEVKLEELRTAVLLDRQQLVAQLFVSARGYSAKREYSQAITVLEAALLLAQSLKDRGSEASALESLGTAHTAAGQFEKAISYLEPALVMRRENKDRLREALLLSKLGGLHLSPGRLEEANRYFDQALPVYRELKDLGSVATTLVMLGFINSALGQSERSIRSLDEALPILREVKDKAGEAMALGLLGADYGLLGQTDKAIRYLNEALPLHREMNNRDGEARTLSVLGSFHMATSQYEKGIEFLEQALALARAANAQGETEFLLLNSLCLSYSLLGSFDKVIAYHEQALALARKVKNQIAEAIALGGIGSAYSEMGQYQKASDFLEQGLLIARQAKNPVVEASLLLPLVNIYHELGSLEKALRYLDQAAEASRDSQLIPIKKVIQIFEVGATYNKFDQFEKGRAALEQGLAIARASNVRIVEGLLLAEIGTAYSGLGKNEQANRYLMNALAIAHEIKSQGTQAYALAKLMAAWRSAGQPRLAILYGKQAVNTVQTIRSGIQGMTPELQQSFLKRNEKPYHELAELLISQGRLTEAEQVLGLLKEDEYFQFIRRDTSELRAANRATDLTPEEAEWSKRYDEIGGRLVAIGTERGELLAKKILTPVETQQLSRIDQDLAAGNQVFEKFLTDLSKHFSAKPEASGKLEQLREAQGIMGDLGELPAGTVAIYTLVGKDKYRAILVTPQVQKAFEYPITAAELNRKILAFRDVVRNPNLDPRPLARELYKILIGNLEADLKQAKAKTLMWSLDGTLRYLPLAALSNGDRYLVEDYQLTVFTPASNARLKDRPAEHWKIAGFGVTKPHPGAPALPSVSDELGGIILHQPALGGVLEGEIRLDDEFTRDSMRTTLLKRFEVVHIASHFRFQPGNETNSFLLLGDGAHFTLSELRNGPNVFNGVQLLTLSACNTGVGDAPGDGQEVEGFGVLAQRKGAKAVIASLWPVADASTSLLMREFYRIRESAPGMPKAEALSRAQLGLLRGSAKPSAGAAAERMFIHEPAARAPANAPAFTVSPGAPYAHPYYWAPFFLMGNWL